MTMRIAQDYAVRSAAWRSVDGVDRVRFDGRVHGFRLSRRERGGLHLFGLTAPELLGEPRRAGLGRGLGIRQEGVEPVVLGFVASPQCIVWPDRRLADAIRLIASHQAGIGEIGTTLIYLRLSGWRRLQRRAYRGERHPSRRDLR